MENRDFYEWYKRKVTDNAQDPPADAWQNIADELDTNEVWDRVAVELDNRARWFGQKSWYYALPALLLLLIPAAVYLYNNNTGKLAPSTTTALYADADSSVNGDAPSPDLRSEETVESSKFQVPSSEFQVQSSKVESSNVESSKLEVPGSKSEVPGSEFQVPGSKIEVPSSKFQVQSSESEVGSGLQVPGSDLKDPKLELELQTSGLQRKRSGLDIDSSAMEGQPSVETASDELSSRESGITTEEASPYDEEQSIASTRRGYGSHGVRRIMLPDSMLIVDPLVVILEPDLFGTAVDLPAIVFSRSLEFGISASVKNTWLLNQTTFMGLEKHTLIHTLPDFGKDVGAVVRYTFSPKLSAQAEGFFISDMGQRYNEYRKGKYIERNVDLNYVHANVLFRYGNNATLLGRLVNGHGFIAGFYYGRLMHASETIDGQARDIRSLYAVSNYGIVTGYEYNQHLFSNFFFSTGVRLNYGLKNIRTHAGSRTATGSFDVNFGLRYRFGKAER